MKFGEKGKVHSVTCYEGTVREQRYSYTLSLTSMPDMVGGQHHAPAMEIQKTKSTLQPRKSTPHTSSWGGGETENHKTTKPKPTQQNIIFINFPIHIKDFDAIPLCMCNKFYCKVPTVHNN